MATTEQPDEPNQSGGECATAASAREARLATRLARSDVLGRALDYLQRYCSQSDIGAWILERELAAILDCNPGHLGRVLRMWWRLNGENEGSLNKARDHIGTCWCWRPGGS